MNSQLPVVHSVGMSFGDIERLAVSVAKSGLFGIKTPEAALTLMMISQAEGRHPALAARDYHIIQGTPAKKAEAMQRDFMLAGGKIEWHVLDDTKADATFSHPQGGTFRCSWDMQRMQQAGLGSNGMWKKYPRQMLRSRCVSEGVRTVFPAATSGMYVPEEVSEFEPRQPIDVTPQKRTPPHDPETGEIHEAQFAPGPTAADLETRFVNYAAEGMERLEAEWKALTTEQRVALGAGRGTSGPKMAHWKTIAASVDAKRQALADEPPEPPAGDPSPHEALQAEPFTETFGNADEAFCHNTLARFLACTTLDETMALRQEELIKKRMQEIPQDMWRELEAAIGKHERELRAKEMAK